MDFRAGAVSEDLWFPVVKGNLQRKFRLSGHGTHHERSSHHGHRNDLSDHDHMDACFMGCMVTSVAEMDVGIAVAGVCIHGMRGVSGIM